MPTIILDDGSVKTETTLTKEQRKARLASLRARKAHFKGMIDRLQKEIDEIKFPDEISETN